MQFISTLIATCFYVGKLPKAPGTWGSLVVPLVLLIMVGVTGDNGFDLLVNEWFMVPFLMGLYTVGTSATRHYMKYTGKHDPKEVVIDEVVGQLISYIMGAYAMVWVQKTSFDAFCIFLGLLFLMFRVCDITKPGLIGVIDRNMKGAHAVMLDDVAAGFVAGLVFSAGVIVWGLF